jgi:hypothetical protein
MICDSFCHKNLILTFNIEMGVWGVRSYDNDETRDLLIELGIPSNLSGMSMDAAREHSKKLADVSDLNRYSAVVGIAVMFSRAGLRTAMPRGLIRQVQVYLEFELYAPVVATWSDPKARARSLRAELKDMQRLV